MPVDVIARGAGVSAREVKQGGESTAAGTATPVDGSGSGSGGGSAHEAVRRAGFRGGDAPAGGEPERAKAWGLP
ncbi:hypothetical protein ACFY7C_01880 [Streptomyces sp. NPDC012769]|uniref:hypothetical protein n=1 Tax=Streptomyces sp. NPDC012769 TaxID=3364848 RepID=UPI0036BB93C5